MRLIQTEATNNFIYVMSSIQSEYSSHDYEYTASFYTENAQPYR